MSKTNRPIIGLIAGYQMYGMGTHYSFFDSLVRGVQAAARNHDCNLFVACGLNLVDPPNQRPAWPVLDPVGDFVPVGPWNTDGLIVVHPMRSPERSAFVRHLKESGFPVVHIGGAEGGPAIDLDNEGGIREAMKHLAYHGHRRVAFVRGFPDDDTGDSGARFRAYQAAAREFSIELDPRLVEYGYHEAAMSALAIKKILASGASFSAVLTSNDDSAYPVIDTLRQAGLRVPMDIAVISFDDFPQSASRVPPLTTVHHPVFERGYEAVGLLLEYIEGGRALDDTIIKVPTHLIVRRSCGCTLDDTLRPTPSLATSEAALSQQNLEEQLVGIATRSVLTETQHLNAAEMYQLSKRLIGAFVSSLKERDSKCFLRTAQALLGRIEETKEDVWPWTLVIEKISEAQETKALVRSISPDPDALRFSQDMLDQVRAAVDRSARCRNVLALHLDTEENGRMAARLHAALDEGQILSVLAEHLSVINLRHADIVFFEADGDDPVAWSVMRTMQEPGKPPIRFPTREFPPPCYSSTESIRCLTLVPLVVQQRMSGYMAFDTDSLELSSMVAHSVNAALAVAHMYRDVVEGRRMAEEARNIKGRFLSIVSHELRTPLSLIMSASDSLTNELAGVASSENVRRNLEYVRAGTQHLDGLIRDVLDLTIDGVGELKLSYESLDIRVALEPVMVVGEQLSHAKKLEWRVYISPLLPRVWADQDRLRQIVLNYITNAVKFTAQGTISLRVDSNDRELTISVEDTGVGVPLDEQESIFEDFEQSKRTVNRGYGGLGLGLAICKRLAEMHAGSIGVKSSGQEGLGSTFFLTLPILESGIEAIGDTLVREQSVLLIDGPDGEAEKLHIYLAKRGINVTRATIESRPIEVTLKPEECVPSVVLIEARLASKHGWELLRALKDNPLTHRSPVLFYRFSEDKGLGAVLNLDYLTKPIGSREMAQAFRRQGVGDDHSTKTILVVEDDPLLLDMHVNVVQACSPLFRVLKASSGREALDLLQQRFVDLIMLDLIMPEMSGFELLEEMQKSEITNRTAIIVLTGQVLTVGEMSRLNKGVVKILQKGVFTTDETLAHIQQTLSHQKLLSHESRHLARTAMAYIHEHHAKPITRKQIASHVGVSEDHLTRYFQHVLGIPPMGYLNRYRINRAKALLGAGEMNVTEVANAVGFQSQFYFSRMFRRETGVAPSAYRRK